MENNVSDPICANKRAVLMWFAHKQNKLLHLNLSCLQAREFCLMSPEAARAGVSAHSGHGELQCGRVFYPPKFYSDVFLPKTS